MSLVESPLNESEMAVEEDETPPILLVPAFSASPATVPIMNQVKPEPRDNGWLWIPAALMCCGMLVYAAQRIQRQDEELARTQKHLEESKMKQDELQANEEQRHRKLQMDLAAHQRRLAEMEQKLKGASLELKSASDKTVARETELQTLVKFLRSEIDASEAQLQILKKALQVKSEIRKALP